MPYASGPADLPALERLQELTGMEYMQAVLDGDMPESPIGQALGFSLEEVDDGCVVYTGTPRFMHCNSRGDVHGGWYGAFLDAAMGCAVMTKVPQGSTYKMLEYKVNLVHALPTDRAVRATGHTDHVGRSIATVRAEIKDSEDGTLYATGSGTCQVIPLPNV